MNTKSVSVAAVFAALAVALNPVFSRISIPAPYFPFIHYEIWEIPIVIVFLVIGFKEGLLVFVINSVILVALSPWFITFGGVVACFSMLSGVYIAYKLLNRNAQPGKALSAKKALIACTIVGIVFRTLVMAAFNYVMLRNPIPFGLNMPESLIIATMPPIAVFNITEPLYVVPIAYLLAKIVNKNLRIDAKF